MAIPTQKMHHFRNTHKRNLSASRQDLQSIAETLMHPSLQKSTYSLYKQYHTYFDQLMESIHHQPIPTVENILLMVANMHSKNYSNRYISRLINSLHYHRNMSSSPDEILPNPQVKIALVNIHK